MPFPRESHALSVWRRPASLFFILSSAHGQGTLADDQRGHDLRTKARDLVVNTPGAMTWIDDSDHFWYPKTIKGGTDFILGGR